MLCDPYVGNPCSVYRELKLRPLYHLEEGIKEESRNRYFLWSIYAPIFGTGCNIAVGVTVEVIPQLFPGWVIGIIIMEKRT